MTDGTASLLSRLSMAPPPSQPNSTHSRSSTKQLPPHLAQSSSVSPPSNHLAQSPTKSPTSSSSHGFGRNGSGGRRRKSSFGGGHSKSPDGSWRVQAASSQPIAIGQSVAPVTGFVVLNSQNGPKSPVLTSRSPPRQSTARTAPGKEVAIGRGDTSTSRWATAPPIAVPTAKPLPPPLLSTPAAPATSQTNGIRIIAHETPSISAVIEPLESSKSSTIPPVANGAASSLPPGSRSPTKVTALGGRSRWDYEGIAEDKRIADLERNVAAPPVAPIPPPPAPLDDPLPPATSPLDAISNPVPSPLPTPIPVVPASPPIVVSLPPILSPVPSPSKSEFKIDWANDESDDELPALDDEWMIEAAKTRRASVSPLVVRSTQPSATPTAILRRPPPKSAPNLFPPRSAAPPARSNSRFPASPTPASRGPPLPPPPPSSSSSVPPGRSRSGRGRGRAPAPPAGAVFARLSGLPPAKAMEGEGSRRGGRRGGPPKESS